MQEQASRQGKLYHITVPVKAEYRAHTDNALIATFTTTFVGVPLMPAEIRKIETYSRTRHTSYEEAFTSTVHRSLA